MLSRSRSLLGSPLVRGVCEKISHLGCSDGRPRRSVLYVPGVNTKALNKCRILKTDCVLMDLEDADDARELVSSTLKAGGFGNRELIVRCNGLGTQWCERDISMVSQSAAHVLAVPKVESAADVQAVVSMLHHFGAPASMSVWCLIETPLGVLNASSICGASPLVSALVMGTSDLTKELGIREAGDRSNLLYALSHCLMAARAHGVTALDGVYLNYKDSEGFKKHCEHGKMLGFDGKTLIHPSTVDVTNSIFSPQNYDVERAKKIVDAYSKANTELVTLDGQLIERLHFKQAESTLKMYESILALEKA